MHQVLLRKHACAAHTTAVISSASHQQVCCPQAKQVAVKTLRIGVAGSTVIHLTSRSFCVNTTHSSVLFAGQQAIQTPWQLAVHGSQYKSLAQSWSWQPTLINSAVCGSAVESWQSLAPKAETTVGFVVEVHSATVTAETFVPQSVILNGISCFVSRA